MNPEELQSKIEELTNQVKSLSEKLSQSDRNFELLDRTFHEHKHSAVDGSKTIDTELNLKSSTPIKLGNGGLISYVVGTPGETNEQSVLSMIAGKDMTGGLGTTTENMQLNFQHIINSAANQSFITGYRPPIYTNVTGSTISVTSAGNTVTVSGYNFTTNELAGALINIFNSSGTFIETQTIASNTATVITITGTWGATTTGGTFFLFVPVFFGSAENPFQRFYTQEGTGGGIRFGVGVTNGGQNGLLYSDATGDLYWRNKGGTSTKLN